MANLSPCDILHSLCEAPKWHAARPFVCVRLMVDSRGEINHRGITTHRSRLTLLDCLLFGLVETVPVADLVCRGDYNIHAIYARDMGFGVSFAANC